MSILVKSLSLTPPLPAVVVGVKADNYTNLKFKIFSVNVSCARSTFTDRMSPASSWGTCRIDILERKIWEKTITLTLSEGELFGMQSIFVGDPEIQVSVEEERMITSAGQLSVSIKLVDSENFASAQFPVQFR